MTERNLVEAAEAAAEETEEIEEAAAEAVEAAEDAAAAATEAQIAAQIVGDQAERAIVEAQVDAVEDAAEAIAERDIQIAEQGAEITWLKTSMELMTAQLTAIQEAITLLLPASQPSTPEQQGATELTEQQGKPSDPSEAESLSRETPTEISSETAEAPEPPPPQSPKRHRPKY